MRRGDHTDCNRLAMQVVAVTRGGFERMTEGVTEVENLAQATLVFVTLDDARLMPQRNFDNLHEASVVASKNRRHLAIERREKLRIHDGAILDHFGEPFAELTIGQGRQRGDVGDDETRLIERADEVF